MTRSSKWARFRGLPVVLWAAVVCLGAAEPIPIPEHYPDVARAFAQRFPSAHLRQLTLDRSISAQAWTNYLAALDFDRSYFLQSDLEEFEPSRERLHEDLRQGQLDFAFDAFERFRRRVDERHAFVESLLDDELDFTRDETYAPRRRQAPWPVDAEAQDDLWRRRIKNEVLGYMLSRQVAAEFDAAEANDDPDPEDPGDANGDEPAHGERPEIDLSPTAFVLRRYTQYRSVLRDSDAEWVLPRFLSAVAAAYDPHSTYMSATSLEDFDISMRLSLVGVGAMLSTEDGAAKIESIIPGGPADQDRRDIRLRPGDKIIGVGQDDEPIQDVMHWPLYRTVRLIRGERGTRVVLLVIPASDPTGSSTKGVDLIRDEVKLEAQAAKPRVEALTDPQGTERKLGIIQLPAFYASMQTRDENAEGFRSATHDINRMLAEFNEQDVDGLLLDLRNNGGGSLREAIDLTGLFIKAGPVVQVREVRAVHVLSDRDPAVAFRRPVVVLVNRLSASASEIVAAALQDYRRAVIVGDAATHGKGSVQTIVALGDDPVLGSIKVTTANYYRISGGSTQLRGIEPDIVIPSVMQYMDLGEDRLPNAMPWTRVSPARFRPMADDLGPALETLRERSASRRADDSGFQRYQRLVDHVRNISDRTEVPLEKEARKALARAEFEFRRVQDSMGEQDADNGSSRDDPILAEALNILADLVWLSDPDAPPEDDGEMLNQWIRRVFAR